jgi:hypothetical protein
MICSPATKNGGEMSTGKALTRAEQLLAAVLVLEEWTWMLCKGWQPPSPQGLSIGVFQPVHTSGNLRHSEPTARKTEILRRFY